MNNSDMPAMPSSPVDTQEGEFETGGGRYITSNGLTKREHIAAMAMQGFLSNSRISTLLPEEIAEDSARVADALLKELER